MRKILALIVLNYCFVFLAVSVSAQEFQTVQDGIEHAVLTRKIKDEPVVVNLLRLDLSKVRLDVVHALDAAIGLEKTSSITARHGAVAAINAGFFRIDRSIFEGDDVGSLMIDGNLFSEGGRRIALVIGNNTAVTQIGIEKLDSSLDLFAEKSKFKISGVNRERKNDETIIYTPDFHLTTLTGNNGIELIVANGKIVDISDGKGSNRIPKNGMIVSASGKSRNELKSLKIGTKLRVTTRIERPYKNNFTFKPEDIVSGVPQLIKDGKIEITWQEEKSSREFVETRHPRTAVAKLKDGKFLMITVDGRQPGTSVGMNLNELAEMLLEFGATDAMNLDGGGSTTMFLDGKIVNKPSDKEGERKVGDAILVTPRKRN